jgi:hypothetical protein
VITEQVVKTLEEVVAFVKEASPTMWEAAHAKVVADIAGSLIGCAFFAFLLFCGWMVCLRIERRLENDPDEGVAIIIGWIITFVCGGFILGIGTSAVKMYIARDWYAIEQLVGLIP